MDFDDLPPEAAFRREVRAWLDANAARRGGAVMRFGEGLSEAEFIAAAKSWQAKKADAGYVAITWPRSLGGREGTAIEQIIFEQEQANYLVPLGVFEIGIGNCMPTVRRWATADLQARYLPPAFTGEEIWCQLFSEPAAGSDTGNIRTRAEKTGNGWRVTGQKVWTSGAHFSDFGILLARSDWDKPKHKGLTMFILDMKAPGVDVRPIHQASGEYHFNEVFLDRVPIPVSHQLGGEGEGWEVMISTLLHERLAAGNALGTDSYNDLIALARRCEWDGRPALEDTRVRAAIANAYINQFGVQLLVRRAISTLSRGGMPGPEMSLVKLVSGKSRQDDATFAVELAGAQGLVGHEVLGTEWRQMQSSWISAPGARIAGGTDEILRNIIAERVLGLPREIRTDRDRPFREHEG